MSRLLRKLNGWRRAKRAFVFWGRQNGKELVARAIMKNRRAAKIPL